MTSAHALRNVSVVEVNVGRPQVVDFHVDVLDVVILRGIPGETRIEPG